MKLDKVIHVKVNEAYLNMANRSIVYYSIQHNEKAEDISKYIRRLILEDYKKSKQALEGIAKDRMVQNEQKEIKE